MNPVEQQMKYEAACHLLELARQYGYSPAAIGRQEAVCLKYQPKARSTS